MLQSVFPTAVIKLSCFVNKSAGITSSSRLMLVCAQVSSFTKEMDFYITTDYLNSVILKTRSLLWELRGSRSGMAGDSVLFTHNPG